MEKSKAKVIRSAPNNDADSEDVSCVNGHYPTTSGREGPKAKIPKLNDKLISTQYDLSINDAYKNKEFNKLLQTQWLAEQQVKQKDFKDESTGAEVYTSPFQVCLLPDFLHHKPICNQLVDEMVEKVSWSRKQMDLYEFYQSHDLSNTANSKLLLAFLLMLRRNVRPWLEQVTNLKLDYVSASCSMYTCGDYLLVHDDLLKDRQIAFIYYLSPWEGAEQWREDQGGCLELFSSDEHCFPHFPVQRKISPRNNQFVFFKVGSRSFHQVGEVTNFDYPRLTINGWFHGASNEDTISDLMRPLSKLHFKAPKQIEDSNLELLLNEVYLKSATKKNIQKRIEDNSEICLYEFLRREIFERSLSQLKTDDALKWRCQGPANAQNYEVMEVDSATGTVAQLIALFTSTDMFALLRDYTDLDLSGPNAAAPTHSLEVQRWSHGNYTVLGDAAISDENTLDLIFYLNASEGASVITYLSPETEEPASRHESDLDSDEDESVLLTITPVDNALNIVYRCEGTTKFTKYVSRNTPLDKGPVYVISCSYKE